MDNLFDYELLDSGSGERLERFGRYVIARPCSTAIWQKRLSSWDRADARYNHQTGWQFANKKITDWELGGSCNLTLRLRLQRNGQIGLFPEHMSYLDKLKEAITTIKKDGRTPQVLNLFAYTGMASLYCRNLGAEITHVDKAKAVLTWAKENFVLNNFETGIRLIPEDAVTFLKREAKRGHTYDIVIADPPNFSRLSQNENWELDTILIKLLNAINDIAKGYLFISSHQSFAFAETVNNLLLDLDRCTKSNRLKTESLTITEKSTGRSIPAGIIVYGKLKG